VKANRKDENLEKLARSHKSELDFYENTKMMLK